MSAEQPRIFISYRREDSPSAAVLLRDYLATHFGDEHIFMDVRSIPEGARFKDEINRKLRECDVLLAIMGKEWPSERLKNPDDFVRLEITTAIDEGVRVIPVLVEQARLPTPKDLPNELACLLDLQAFEIRHGSFKDDADRLAKRIDAPDPETANEATSILRSRRGMALSFLIVVGVLSFVVWTITRETTPPYIAAFMYRAQPTGQPIQIQSFLKEFEHRSQEILLYVFVHESKTEFIGQENKPKWNEEIKAIKRRLKPGLTEPRKIILEKARFEVVGTPEDPASVSESNPRGIIKDWEGSDVELSVVKGCP